MVTKPDARLQRAATLHAEGQLEAAATGYGVLLAEQPDDPQLLLLMGLLEGQRGRFEAATGRFTRLLELQPEHGEARLNLARALRAAGRRAEAIARYDELLATEPANTDLRFDRMNVEFFDEGRYDEAVQALDQLLADAPRHVPGWVTRGHSLRALGRLSAALESFRRAISINPSIADSHLQEGQLLLALGQDQDARESFDRAVQLAPGLVAAHVGRAAALMRRHNVVSALVSADRARQINPACAEAWCLMGTGQTALGYPETAVKMLTEALRLRPEYPEALFARAETLQELARHDEAVRDFEKVLALNPSLPLAEGHLLHARMRAADWRGFDERCDRVLQRLRAGEPIIAPLALQAICHDEADARRGAEIVTAHFHPRAPRSLARPRTGARSGKLRIGYLSGEFREHATAMLMTGVWEKHDKSAFEIIGIDTGQTDESPRRARIEAAFDRMVVVADISDNDAALRIATLELDVLVNLNGFFGKARPGIFAQRPAPVQVNYLGFPGTLGADYIDYLLADQVVIPPASAAHYAEKIIYLPGCYQPNDNTREISVEPVSRDAEGLPEGAFVFCCFNNVYKITPQVFAGWMRILARVPQAVLWLLETAESTRDRLRAAAITAGIDAERLVFAEPQAAPLHLARHRLADLFLDTAPYNADITASDALWAGLPLLTMRGTTFPGRVAESLLRSVGLETLVCADLAAYEARAIALATDAPALAALRKSLLNALPTAALFDTARSTRLLESAFRYMVDRADRGLPPEGVTLGG